MWLWDDDVIDIIAASGYTNYGPRAHFPSARIRSLMRLGAQKIALERGGRRLFSGLSFQVGAGEALVGFLPLSEGSLVLQGGDAEASLGEQAHCVGHADALKGALTAGENLEFWAGVLGGDPRRPAWLAALGRLGLAHVADFPVRALSAGQQRRVALARLLVARRPLWLLDEPTTALDAAAQSLFAGVMREHLEAGGLIIAATHAPLGVAARTLRLQPRENGGREA